MTKPEIDTSIERWAAEYREQAELELIEAATRQLRDALPDDLPADNRRVFLCNRLEAVVRMHAPYCNRIQLVEWAARLDGSEIKPYGVWADTIAQDEMSEEAYAEWKGAGL